MIIKRIFDIALSLLGIILSLPLWIILGLIIWAYDRGSIFYLQERIGKGGCLFKSVKFRSMKVAAEKNTGAIQASTDDARITPLGRFMRATALDELPQLWNILIGEMSFVGPRALRPVEKEVNQEKEEPIYKIPGFSERSSVRPGLTGIAQILAPRDIAREEKFKYDIWYIKNANLWLDIYIIFISFLITFGASWPKTGVKPNIFLRVLKARVNVS